MSVYGELNNIPQHRAQFAFKGKRKHRAKLNISNLGYPILHNNIEIPHGLIDHVIVPDSVKSTFIIDTESIYKTHSIVNNVGRALVKNKVLMFGSKEIDTISNSDI